MGVGSVAKRARDNSEARFVEWNNFLATLLIELSHTHPLTVTLKTPKTLEPKTTPALFCVVSLHHNNRLVFDRTTAVLPPPVPQSHSGKVFLQNALAFNAMVGLLAKLDLPEVIIHNAGRRFAGTPRESRRDKVVLVIAGQRIDDTTIAPFAANALSLLLTTTARFPPASLLAFSQGIQSPSVVPPSTSGATPPAVAKKRRPVLGPTVGNTTCGGFVSNQSVFQLQSPSLPPPTALLFPN